MSALGGEFFLRYNVIRDKKKINALPPKEDSLKSVSDNSGDSSMKGDA